MADTVAKRWRAREKAAFALFPILEREGIDTVSAGELADAAVEAFEQAMREPLPDAWRVMADTFTMPRDDLWSPLAMVKWVSGERVGDPPVLHQLWTSLTTGRQEWRVVPTEPHNV